MLSISEYDCRGCSKASERGAPLERADEALRRTYMLPPEALRQELHQWLAHDGRWISFREWIEVHAACTPRHITCLHWGLNCKGFANTV